MLGLPLLLGCQKPDRNNPLLAECNKKTYSIQFDNLEFAKFVAE
jgi:hypothetical protein